MRKGLGRGKGKGYKNIINTDPGIHSDSAYGRKQPQGLRMIPPPPLVRHNKLPVQVGVIVPSTEKDKEIPEQEFEKRVESEKKWFSRRFGGDTSIQTVGSYFDGKKLIKEPGVLVQSSMSVEKYMKKRELLAKHILDRKKDWKQDTMLMKIEGQDFILPKKSYIDHDDKQSDLIIVS